MAQAKLTHHLVLKPLFFFLLCLCLNVSPEKITSKMQEEGHGNLGLEKLLGFYEEEENGEECLKLFGWFC